jgi:hypothetical protein
MYGLSLKRAIQKGLMPDSLNRYADLAYSGVLSRVSMNQDHQAELADICQGTGVSADVQYYFDRQRRTNDNHGVGAFLIMNELMAHNNLPWIENEIVNTAVPDPEPMFQEQGIRVFPNPCSDHLLMDFGKKMQGNLRLTVYSMDGSLQLVKETELRQQSGMILKVSSLETGFYVLTAETSQESRRIVFMKN